MSTLSQRIRHRRDTAANWTATNPVLADGELGIESDAPSLRGKYGNGTQHWNDLPYVELGPRPEFESVSFDLGAAVIPSEGEVAWDATKGSLLLGKASETHYLVDAYGTPSNGQVIGWNASTDRWEPTVFGSGATGPTGPQGNSSSYFDYQAKTTATSGYPGDGHILWNTATQANATALLVSHLTQLNVDIDIFLSLLIATEIITIQDSTVSSNYQQWRINATPTNINANTVTSYWSIPVTLLSSGGTGTTNFSNNHQIILALVSGAQGATGPIGATGPTGPAGSIPTYIHNQPTPSTTWTIAHNLGFKPSVELLNSGSQEIEGDVVHISYNVTMVYFTQSITGFARLN